MSELSGNGSLLLKEKFQAFHRLEWAFIIMGKCCLILMLSGHEVRQFGHSGMISNLIDRGWNVIVAARHVDKDLSAQLDSRVELFPVFNEPVSKRHSRLKVLLDRVHQTLEENLGKTKWIDEWKERKGSFRIRLGNLTTQLMASLIAQTPWFYKRLLQYEGALETENVSNSWIKFHQARSVTVVITNTPRSEILQPALVAAKMLQIPRLLFYHSIKDVSAKGRLIHEFSALGVWNSWMKDEVIRQNPYTVRPGSIEITGCSHFDCVGRDDLLISEEEFRRTIGASLSSRLLLYPACVHHVVPDQGRYIDQVIRAIRSGILPKDLQIVIRTNPMDLSDYFEKKFNGCGEVIVQKAGWRMEPSGDWNFQRRDDMLMYNSLLHYSSLCFGIPSTVTFECAISCLPVINIGYDLPCPSPPRSMKSFWNAEFYQEAVRHRVATLCETDDQMLEEIRGTLMIGRPRTAENAGFLNSYLGVPPHFSERRYIEMIDHLVAMQLRPVDIGNNT